MFNEMLVVAITPFSGTSTPDKNGNQAIMMQCIAGKMPNRNVLSGTVASRVGLEIGKTYLINCREQGFDKLFGPDYVFVKVKELETGEDIIRASKELGTAEVFTVLRPEGFEDKYQRKGVAIEGLRTKRIKEGEYIPVNNVSYEHETAPEIIEGSSTKDDPFIAEVKKSHNNEAHTS